MFALREGDLLALAGLAPGARWTALVAEGRDGDLATAAAQALGVRVVRGSSLRGGTAALLQIVRALRASPDPLALVVDGPLGPAGVAKPGVVACAALLERPVVPVAVAARPRLVLSGSWSRMQVPLPGARVVVALGPELAVPPRPRPRQAEALRAELTRRLAVAAERAETARASAPLPAALREGTR